MAGTKSRAFAVIFTILVIISSMYLGALRSFSNLRSQAERYYYDGTERNKSITELFYDEIDTAENLITISERYPDVDKKVVENLDNAIYDLYFDMYEPELAGSRNESLQEAFTLLVNQLKLEDLSQTDQTYVSSMETGMASREQQIKANPYNDAVDVYNDSLEDFPATILSGLTGAKPLKKLG